MGLFLIETYKQAELKPDAMNKGKLLTLLRLFDAEEPTRKKFIGEMIAYVFLCFFRYGGRRKANIGIDGLRNAGSIQLENQNCIM